MLLAELFGVALDLRQEGQDGDPHFRRRGGIVEHFPGQPVRLLVAHGAVVGQRQFQPCTMQLRVAVENGGEGADGRLQPVVLQRLQAGAELRLQLRIFRCRHRGAGKGYQQARQRRGQQGRNLFDLFFLNHDCPPVNTTSVPLDSFFVLPTSGAAF